MPLLGFDLEGDKKRFKHYTNGIVLVAKRTNRFDAGENQKKQN